MIEFAVLVSGTVAGAHHKNADRRFKGSSGPHTVIDAFEPVVVPLLPPAQGISDGGFFTEVDLTVRMRTLPSVNPGPHDHIHGTFNGF